MSVSTDLDTSVAQALLASRIVGKRASYTADNPTEASKVLAYLKGGTRPTSVATAMGLHLVSLRTQGEVSLLCRHTRRRLRY